MKKKKRIKVVLALLFVLVVFFVSVVNCFGVEYGNTPYDLEGWENYEPNELPSNTEQPNPYTLVIYIEQTGSIDEAFTLYQMQNNTPVSIWVHIEYGTVYVDDGNEEIDYSIGIIMIPFYSTSAQLFNIFNDTTEGYVLNNQQLVTMQNYTYTEAQVEALETDAYQSGVQAGLTTGRQEGYDLGYQAGYDTANEDNEFGTAGAQLITAVVEAPVNVFSNMLNFEILGVNVLGLVVALLSFGLVFAILKRVL